MSRNGLSIIQTELEKLKMLAKIIDPLSEFDSFKIIQHKRGLCQMVIMIKKKGGRNKDESLGIHQISRGGIVDCLFRNAGTADL